MRYRLHRERKVVLAIPAYDNDCISICHVDPTMNTSFQLPQFGPDYTEYVSARCESLINERWIISSADIPAHAAGTRVLLFVDDLLGTGDHRSTHHLFGRDSTHLYAGRYETSILGCH